MQLPFYVLVSVEWFDKDPSTAAARLLQGAPIHVIPLSGVNHLAIFSSEDEANDYLRWKHLENENRIVEMEMPHECAMVLERALAFGVNDIAFDFASTMPGVYPIGHVLEQVRSARLERDDGG